MKEDKELSALISLETNIEYYLLSRFDTSLLDDEVMKMVNDFQIKATKLLKSKINKKRIEIKHIQLECKHNFVDVSDDRSNFESFRCDRCGAFRH